MFRLEVIVMDINTGDRLFALRKKYGLSQEELAEKIDVSRQSISKWERGEASPNSNNLIAMSKLYGITLDELLGTEKSSKADEKNPVNNSLMLNLMKFPVPIIVIAVFLAVGFGTDIWHPTWLILSLLPIYYWFAAAFKSKTKRAALFAMPIPLIVLVIYLAAGLTAGIWHPTWIMFLIIPAYYWGIGVYVKK